MNKKGMSPPPEYEQARRNFYAGKRGSRTELLRSVWLAGKVPLDSEDGRRLIDELFLAPLRKSDYAHFRRIADAVKKLDEDPSSGIDGNGHLDQVEPFVFVAFEMLRRSPIKSGKWPSWSDVKDLALNLWAQTRVKSVKNVFKLTKDEDKQLKAARLQLPTVTNWNHVRRTTGLLWLE